MYKLIKKINTFLDLKKLSGKIITTIVITATAGSTIWALAAFTEPSVGPASSNQDFAQNILGANNADNAFDSSSVVASSTGSIIERLEYLEGEVAKTRLVASASTDCNTDNQGLMGFSSDHRFVICDSDTWEELGTAADESPDPYDFIDKADLELNTITLSDIVQISGIDTAILASVTSTSGTPEFKVCANSDCTSIVTNWDSIASYISNTQYIQLRMTTSNSPAGGTEFIINTTLGAVTSDWSITTGDTTPVNFDNTDQTGVADSTLTESSIVQITGINIATPVVSITGDGNPAYRICSDSGCSSVTHDWSTSAGSIDNNEYLQLRLTSSALANTVSSATITVGSGSDTWNVTTSEYMMATGGTITTSGDYKIHAFTSSDTFTVTAVGTIGTVDALIVAGGGGGGLHSGAGGGAGGLIWNTSISLNNGSHAVTVGAGGAGADVDSTSGSNGLNSVFTYNTSETLTALGGGGGGYQVAGSARAGGSGGGAARNTNDPGAGNQPGSADGGYGNAGGGCASGCTDPNYPGHGGGGAGTAGAAGDQNVGGVGGDGKSDFVNSSQAETTSFLAAANAGVVSGSYRYIAGGGGGSMQYNSKPGGAGGKGGGGAGGAGPAGAGADGTANTGSGGGGNSYASTPNGDGGSGIVIIKYRYQ